MAKLPPGRNRRATINHPSSLIIEPPRRPVNPSPVSWLITIRTMIGIMSLLTTLDSISIVVRAEANRARKELPYLETHDFVQVPTRGLPTSGLHP